MKTYRWAASWMLAALTLMWTGCGGEDGGGDPDPEPPAPTSLVVWARGNQPDFNVPITIYLDQQSIGTITANAAPSATAPTGTAGTQVRVERAPGTYVVRAVSQNGLIWAETVTLTQSNQTNTLLDNTPSSQGRVSFSAASGGSNTSGITVVLDGLDTLGTITTRQATAPACGATGSLTALRPAGAYVYQALSSTGACLWQGQVVVPTDGTCTTVHLAACSN